MLLRYSNFALPLFSPEFAGLRESAPLGGDELPAEIEPRRTVVTAELRAAVLDRYQAGQARREIAAALGIGQTTVIKIVRDSGTEVRFARLTVAQCAEMARLYQAGMSQVEIARQFSCNPSNIWHVLERAGLVGRR